VILRKLAPLAGACLILAACSGGGAVGTPASPIPPSTSVQNATGTLTIGVPQASTAANARKPAFVSASTTYATLWIDAGATGFRQACSSSATCTINWTSTSGSHTFSVEVDDSPAVAGGGTVLADASVSENLAAGFNALSPIALNGVAAQVALVAENADAAGSAPCVPLGTGVNCYQGQWQVLDYDGNVIVPPGGFDNGGVCLDTTDGLEGFVAMSCTLSPSATPSFTLSCQSGATGTFGIVAGTYDGTTYGAMSGAQLGSYNLAYPNSDALAVQNWPTYDCTNGTISATAPANGSVTVQSHLKKR